MPHGCTPQRPKSCLRGRARGRRRGVRSWRGAPTPVEWPSPAFQTSTSTVWAQPPTLRLDYECQWRSVTRRLQPALAHCSFTSWRLLHHMPRRPRLAGCNGCRTCSLTTRRRSGTTACTCGPTTSTPARRTAPSPVFRGELVGPLATQLRARFRPRRGMRRCVQRSSSFEICSLSRGRRRSGRFTLSPTWTLRRCGLTPS